MDGLRAMLDGVVVGTDWMGQQRHAAAEFVRAHGLPDVRQEAWKYTSLGALKGVAYRAASADDGADMSAAAFSALDRLGDSALRAVLVNGRFRRDLSNLDALPAGVRVRSLNEVLDGTPDELAAVYAREPTPDTAFSVLNIALAGDGIVLDLAPDAVLDAPLHLVFVASGDEALVAAPRVVLRVGRNARARVIEEYLGVTGNRNLTNVVTDIALDAGAVLYHHRVQNEPDTSAHIGRINAHVGGLAELYSDSVAFGGALTRIDIDVALAQRGARCRLNGLFAVTGTQHVDHHTTIDHRVGDTHSEELYRGVLDGRGRGVFNGKVIVRQDAQGITARQASNNLLLSRQAEIDTKPELEIYADDVSCAHGATVGELDAAALFYLRSRGVHRDQARALLTYAFAEKVIEAIPLDSLRAAIEQRFIGHQGLGEVLRALQEQSTP